MPLRKFIIPAVIGLFAGSLADAFQPKRELPPHGKPNILIFYADDLGYGDLSSFNPESKIPTPHLDRLAEEGVRFTDAHSSSGICTPSRYAMLTGRYHWRKFHGIVGAFEDSAFDAEELTLPEMLQAEGYTTAIIGKWHLGWNWDAIAKPGAEPFEYHPRGRTSYRPDALDWSKPVPNGPLAHGFDYYFGDTVINFPPYAWIENDRVLGNPDRMVDTDLFKPVKEATWQARPGPMVEGWDPYDNIPVTTRKGIAKIHEFAAQDDPFFLMFSYPSPHAPIIPNDEFDGRSEAGPYGDFVVETDESVGRLLAALDVAGVADNTIVIFTADNGAEYFAYDRAAKTGHWSSEPLRGAKRDIYEGGHRVPTIIRWPDILPGGGVNDALISQIDFMATFAAILGVDLPDDQAVDSYDQLPVLLGQSNSVRNSHVHNTFENHYAIRQGDWVLIDAEMGYTRMRDEIPAWEARRGYKADDLPVELYDLSEDPEQGNNLAAEYPEKVTELQSRLRQIREQGDSASRLTNQPNVVLVITDDQGYGDLSVHGNPVLKTPEMDRLHSESIRLTDFHVSPTCSPTRGSLMSGQWANRAGPWHTIMGRSMLFEDKTTLGEVFAGNGYATGLFGKWHLGDNYPYRPEDRGFQEVVRHAAGGVGQTPDYWNNAYFDDTYFHNGEPREFEGFCTDVFFGEAKRFIREQADAGKPFFAYISTNAPHGPFHSPEEYSAPYLETASIHANLPYFYGMIANIDANIGALREWLEQEGLAANTIFIFMTDNGTSAGHRVFNAGMRGNKGDEYDGGHRVPFFLHWPAGGFDQPQDVDRLTAHVDVLPTLIELCGLDPLPAGYVADGRSMVPLLRDPQVDWPDRVVVTDSQRVIDPVKWKQSSTMTERWRLINGIELYDIEADPAQENDIAKQRPEVVAELRAAYEAWWADITPAFSKTSRIRVGHPAENPSTLTAHDWITSGLSPPWNQSTIRRNRQTESQHWALTVESAGSYRIALRRWPRESGLSLRSAAEPGDPVPGLTAYRDAPGVALPIVGAGITIAGQTMEMTIDEDVAEVVFEIDLPAGDAELEAQFTMESGDVEGAFYAYVEKL